MKKIYLNIILALGLIATSGCTYDFPEPDQSTLPTAGNADFSKLVVVGNSITSGYMDGALYNRGQQNSYGKIVAGQLEQVGGGEFNQPDINAPNGFFGFAPDGTTPLGRLIIPSGASAPSPIVPGDPIGPFSGDKASLNNFGVPGVSVTTALLPGYGTLNPYFGRFASNPASATLMDDAAAAQGTFFLMWLGNNNVLGYATAGASGTVDGPLPGDLTSVADFTGAFGIALQKMTANGAKGLVANIPNVTDIPYFTTVPYNAFPLDEATANLLNQGYTANAYATISPLVITEAIRLTQVIPGVAAEVVRLQTLGELLQKGVPQADAEAQAAAFVGSPDGQAAVQGLAEQFIADPTNAALADFAAAVDAQMQSAEVQAGIKGFSETYLAAFAANPASPQATAPFTQGQFDQVTAEVNNQVGILQAAGFLPVVQAGNNPFIIDDPNSPTGIRSLRQGELMTLTAAAVPTSTVQGWLLAGRGYPDQYVLTADEIGLIETRTIDFNAAIAAAVSSTGGNVRLVDTNSIFDSFVNQRNPSAFNGVGADGTLLPPFGIFSYDGVHPNGRGHAWIANNFIKAMNSEFNANIPLVNENNYPGNDLP